MLEVLTAFSVWLFSHINETTVKAIWTLIVAPGMPISGLCLFIYLTDERIRQAYNRKQERQGRAVDRILQTTSYIVVMNEALRFCMHLILAIITVVAWTVPARGGAASQPTAGTLVFTFGLMLLALLLDIKSIVTLLGRYRIDRISQQIPEHPPFRRRATDFMEGSDSHEPERAR